jgi:hypothetical protein
MELLKAYVMRCLSNCAKTTTNRRIWMDQAFGAIQLYVEEHPSSFDEVEQMWNEIKPHFERWVYGCDYKM